MTPFEKIVRYFKERHRIGEVIERRKVEIEGKLLTSMDWYYGELRKAGYIHEVDEERFILDSSFGETSLDEIFERCRITRTVIERLILSLRKNYCAGQVIARSPSMVLPDMEDVPSDTVSRCFVYLKKAGLVTTPRRGEVAPTADLVHLPEEIVLGRYQEVSRMKKIRTPEPIDQGRGEDVVMLPTALELLDRTAILSTEARAILDRHAAWTIISCLEKRMEREGEFLSEAQGLLRKTAKSAEEVRVICEKHTKDAILDYPEDRVTSRP